MTNQLVSIKQLAAELGVGVPAARRIALELSAYLMVRPGRQQMEARQLSYCWTRDHADRIIEERQRRGFKVGPPAAQNMRSLKAQLGAARKLVLELETAIARLESN